MRCSVCGNSELDVYPPEFVIYSLKFKEVRSVLCAQCASNMETAFKAWLAQDRAQRELDAVWPTDDDIPF